MQHDLDKQMDQQTNLVMHRLAQHQDPRNMRNVRVVQRVTGAWLGNQAVPIQADTALPEIFHRPDFRFQFGRRNIMTIAEKLTQVTHIPVHVQSDVLTPVNHNNIEYEMNYLGTLSGYLELLCARMGISWDYHEGVITLRRLVTKTFTLKAIPGSSGFDAALGRDAQMHTGTQSGAQSGSSISMGGYASTTKVKMGSTYSVWTSLRQMIEAVKSPLGRYSISEATGTITMTDTRTAVEELSRIIDHENSMLTRQIAMRVEVLSVKMRRGQDYGIDWNLIFQKVTDDISWSLRFSSPSSAIVSNAASMGISILSPMVGANTTNGAANGATGPWSGSKAFFKALAQYGQVSVVTTANALTVNRQPVPVAITQQTGYLAEVTPAPAGASGNAGGTPGLTPGIVTTGFMLNLLPTVLDSNHILLQFSVGISSLNALDKQTSGAGSHQQSIQTPIVSSTDFLQKVAMRPGETLVLSGYERQSGQYDKRTLSNHAPVGLGGSFSGSNEREAVVILVTPVVAESAI